MIKSMTGFGMCEQSQGNTQVHVELKTINHRFFDFTFNGPRSFVYLEDQLKKIVHSYVKRGSLNLYLSVKGSDANSPQVETNWPLFDQYVHAAKEMQRRSGFQLTDLDAILQLPGIFSLRDADNYDAQSVETLVLNVVREAAERLIAMREKEGEALRSDLLDKIREIRLEVDRLEVLMPEVRTQYKMRLRTAIADFLGQNQSIDENRLMNEMAVFINKTAIDEEVTRLKSHLNQCTILLDENSDIPVGRRFDFLIQEMNREVNTIGSKGNHAEVSRFVVSMKTEIEKLREQVQNIE
ncbi:YicC family protein [Sporolactobacillus shoreicorticis]|uniref:YicC/YloC family endoribonuclease n=1 Tax=Sporolactobacillus shoreicorticis TaxID=1923877 RepID=A0ABW5S308_9BACL|nr:YicC/YloC family endoribonuclease [Sporolactobacillus shoreicorticis]MCO7127987.1 YicC family protein [Sporolactobacillus shoreicorticis]